MALWRRRRRTPYTAVSDEERMSRYVYLLNTLPATVIERAHESAFRAMPPSRRREMFEKLRPFMSEQERVREPEPTLLAGVLSRLSPSGGGSGTALLEEDRRPDDRRREESGRGAWPFDDPVIGAYMASHFLTSAVVLSYFTVGAGSIGIAGEPAWVGEMGGVQPDGYGGGFDGGGYSGDGGGGYDGGGFGGFDGGGFGGGDGGGGMG